VAHDDFLDVIRGDLRALESLTNGDGTKIWGAQRRKSAEEFANGRTRGADDYWGAGFIGHGRFFCRWLPGYGI
jgi:hypothetical protein